MKKVDQTLVGKHFGDLTVIEFNGMDKHHHSQWLCQCECGNRVTVSRDHLVTGNTTSCGCRKHIPRYEDIAGKRFGRLTVVSFDHLNERHNSYWLCQCDCGNRVVVKAAHLNSGNTTSCGCYKKERTRAAHTTHGLSGTHIYRVWQGMHTRCENENYDSYHRYGKRGIQVCEDWKVFENFREWAKSSGYSSDLSLDRINNDGITVRGTADGLNTVYNVTTDRQTILWSIAVLHIPWLIGLDYSIFHILLCSAAYV